MKLLTIATEGEGYYSLLKSSADEHGFDLITLGWKKEWLGLGWKIKLYLDELKKYDKEEIVAGVDGYDVVVIADVEETKEKFIKFDVPILFSGQRYFPGNKFMQKLSDQLMSNSKEHFIGEISNQTGYDRPCMGLFIGYAGNLVHLFEQLYLIEKEQNINNDQILLNIHFLENPKSLTLDNKCDIFQNLWRTRKGLYGKISSKDPDCEVLLYQTNNEKFRVQNKRYKTHPCFIHAPFNLDMNLLLKEMNIAPPKLGLKKGMLYWKYTMMYFIKRGFKFFVLK